MIHLQAMAVGFIEERQNIFQESKRDRPGRGVTDGHSQKPSSAIGRTGHPDRIDAKGST